MDRSAEYFAEDFMELTIHSKLDSSAIAAAYEMYQVAVGPLATRAAARHVLTEDEFAEDMVDLRIDKYMVTAEDGSIVGLSTLVTDIAAVPWVSSEFYAEAYPDHFARGAIYYFGITLVDPRDCYHGAYPLMARAIIRRLVEADAVCGCDVCDYNEERGVTRSIVAMCRAGGAVMKKRDTQVYYTAVFGEQE